MFAIIQICVNGFLKHTRHINKFLQKMISPPRNSIQFTKLIPYTVSASNENDFKTHSNLLANFVHV